MSRPSATNSPMRRGRATAALGRPPGATAEDTVKRLIEAAKEQFGMNSYSGARMTEIASAAGVTHSSIYQYFASKQELYQATFAAALDELLPDYLEAATTDGTLRSRLAEIMRASARAHQRSPLITPFLASLPIELRRHPDLMPALEEQGNAVVVTLGAMFAEARSRGELSADVADRDLLVGFIGAAMGIGLMCHAMPGSDMSAAVEVVISGLDGSLFCD